MFSSNKSACIPVLIAGLVVVSTLFIGHSSASEKVVRIWHTEPNHMTLAVMREIIADYEMLNPGIRIEQEAIGWSSLLQKLQAADLFFLKRILPYWKEQYQILCLIYIHKISITLKFLHL